MKHLGTFIGVVVVGLLAGCGPMDPEAPAGEQDSRPTPEQVEEMLSKIPVPDEQMLEAFADACQPTSTNSCVNAGYGSCASWSATYECGSPSACDASGCPQRVCYGTTRDSCVTEYQGSYVKYGNRYRVCFNAAGQSCTEYELATQLVCGC